MENLKADTEKNPIFLTLYYPNTGNCIFNGNNGSHFKNRQKMKFNLKKVQRKKLQEQKITN